MQFLIEKLNRLAASAVHHSEVVAALFVLAVIFMMIMPLPTLLVDVLISLNICIAILLVVFAMYLPGPLAFSTFPGVLLLTTLFRLALSITTTRLILLQHDAGSIVEAFGDFVVGGDLVVGLVIFLILTIVQFVVITKGSERIAEVAARFSLDGMPGKQMSIDSDLRGGLIDGLEAKRRRDSLSRESQLYGAMDGAMKFVKGDAIAGLVIVAVNLIGGLAVGTLKHGMSAAEAIPVYSVLTIGDGLVAQIPALLISLTAGMIVTRVNSENKPENANVGREMAEQILSQPKAWLIAAGAMMIFAIIPGMPTMVFLALSIITCTVGLMQSKIFAQQKASANTVETEGDRYAEIYEGKVDVRRFDPIKPYLLTVSDADSDREEIIQAVRRSRNIIVSRLGFTLPSLSIKYSTDLRPGEFRFAVNEIPKLDQCVYYRSVRFARLTELQQKAIKEIDSEVWHKHAIADESSMWLPERYAEVLKQHGVLVESSALYIARSVEKIFLQTGAQFIGVQETHALLGWLESEQSELAKELQRSLPVTKFAEVLQRLAAERVSLRSLRLIAESLIEWGHQERDAVALTEHVRCALRQQICYEHSRNGHVQAIFLGSPIEQAIRKAVNASQKGGYLSIAPQLTAVLIQGVADMMLRNRQCGPPGTPPAIIVPADIRRVVRKIIENDYFQLPVLSFNEIVPELTIHTLGKIEPNMKPKDEVFTGQESSTTGQESSTTGQESSTEGQKTSTEGQESSTKDQKTSTTGKGPSTTEISINDELTNIPASI